MHGYCSGRPRLADCAPEVARHQEHLLHTPDPTTREPHERRGQAQAESIRVDEACTSERAGLLSMHRLRARQGGCCRHPDQSAAAEHADVGLH
eukprot:scaffold231553_cov28-Tisochrysis_lutea.AAC.1